jgi:TolB-like protein/tetratricopeptide (TPR) repeat protein
LAVLVFQHGPDDGLDELAIALTRNLIGALGDVPHLSVRSLQAVWPYRNGQTPLDSVGRRLGVPWIVGGRVDRIGDQNVVSVELTDATTGRRLDGRQAVGAPGNDKDLVETLVPNVAALLRGRIGDHVRLEGWRARTRSGEAFASVNRAYRDVREADVLMAADAPGARLRLRRADSALEQASRADPAWAEPHIQRAWIARKAAFMLGPEGLIADSVVATLGRGVEHAAAARRVAPGDPRAREVHGVLLHGMSVVLRSKASAATLQAEAETLLREATDADSTLPRALNTLSSIHYARGELEQARLMAARAYAADAYSEDAQQLLARLFTIEFDDANDEEARRWCGEYARMFRNDWFTGYCRLMLMAWDSTAVPDADEAWRIARAATAAAPDTIRAPIEAQLQTLVAGVLARLGPTGGAEPVLAAVSAARTADPAVAREPFGTDLLQLEAGVRLRLGQPEIAIALLRDYLERHPGSPERLARGRRFRDVPVARLRDAVSQPR